MSLVSITTSPQSWMNCIGSLSLVFLHLSLVFKSAETDRKHYAYKWLIFLK